ncbi:ABC transporter permease [Lentzea tibetensis]|uniref:ABC transporter permease n=1 Tax=Lentzea tibetensis TaxID=2591470 RepID=UPI001645BDC5|nr:ABC transporter permease subunit [Lentzea tibetensis]
MRTALVLVLLAALVGAPLVALARVAGERGWSAAFDTLTSLETGTAVRNTLVLAVVVTVLGCACGTAVALTTRDAGRWLRLALLLPVLVPEFVLGFGWSQAYGPSGFADDLLGVEVPGLLGPVGIVLVLTVHAVPLAYLAVAAGLAVRAEPDLERAARASGAGPFVVLQTVLLPLLRLPLLAAGVLVFVTTVNSFAIPQVLGGYPTMTTLVYADLNLSADPDAFGQLTTVALAMAALVLVVVGLADTVLGSSVVRTGTPGAVAGRSRRHWFLGAYTVFAIGLPMLVVLGVSITRGPGLAPVPANWTLANYVTAFAGPTWPALLRTLLLAVLAAAILTVLSGLVVSLRRPVLGTVLTLCFAVPGSALAVGTLIAYGRLLGTSAAIILVVYLAKLWAVAYRPVLAGVDRLGADLVPAARSSGARPFTAVRTVVLPPLSTALATAAGLVFVLASHELTMSSILYGPGSQTFAVVVLNQQQLGDVGASAALSVVLTAPLALLAVLLLRGARARTS